MLTTKKTTLPTRLTKRIIDVLVSTSGLILTAPLTLSAALAIATTMGRPILFRQQRPGLGGQAFEILKFRTMRPPTAQEEMLLSDANRITKLGAFLRSTSIDELPTLLNVLKGDMSLIGPRPLLMCYLNRYTPRQARRHAVKPGITGWAQINGRNTISWEQKFDLDLWYIDHASMRLDLVILLKTIKKVITRDGISAQGQATMSEFMGTQNPTK